MAKDIGTSDLKESWASTGAKVKPGDQKIDTGWEQGEQPPHEYFNWILNDVTNAFNHIFKNGVPLWSATTEYSVGNFTQVSGTIYRAKVANVNSLPPNNNWLAVAPISVGGSIIQNAGVYQLSGDSDNPGADLVYGTDDQGNRGFYPRSIQTSGFTTGDLKWRYDIADIAGFVRLNAKTIGKAGSGATERANADTEALYIHLWTVDPNLIISGGRGDSAAADFAAGKRLTLPDGKNRQFLAIDGMGGTNSGRVTGGNILGASGGNSTHTITTEELPNSVLSPVFQANYAAASFPGSNTVNNGVRYDNYQDSSDQTLLQYPVGGGQAFNNMSPYLVGGTVYIKL